MGICSFKYITELKLDRISEKKTIETFRNMFHFSDEFIDLLQDYLRQEPGIEGDFSGVKDGWKIPDSTGF